MFLVSLFSPFGEAALSTSPPTTTLPEPPNGAEDTQLRPAAPRQFGSLVIVTSGIP